MDQKPDFYTIKQGEKKELHERAYRTAMLYFPFARERAHTQKKHIKTYHFHFNFAQPQMAN